MNSALDPKTIDIPHAAMAAVHRYEADPTQDANWVADAAAWYGLEDEDPKETYACFARRVGEAA